jgi:hypothetical protein
MVSQSLPNSYTIHNTTINEISTSWHFELLSVNLLDIHNLPYACCTIVAAFVSDDLSIY